MFNIKCTMGKYKIKNFVKILLICLVTNGVYLKLSFASGYGTTGAQILNLYSSAKIAAMGNAHAGLADDLNAVIYNPAGLTQLYGTEFQFTHLIYFLDTSMSAMTYGQKIGRIGMGLKFKIFKAEDTYRNNVGYNDKKFDIKYSQYTLGLGFPVSPRHSMGISINSVSENFNLSSIDAFGKDKKDTVMGFDIGWHYRGFRGDSFGLVIRNIGGDIQVDKEKDKQPLKYVLGGGHRMGKFIFVWEAITGRQMNFAWQSGLEIRINGLKIRSGLIYITKPDITVGFGLPYRNWLLDYAFLPHQDLGIAHRISLGMFF